MGAVKKGLSKIDPTTSDGRKNLLTGGLVGGVTGVGEKLLGGDKPKSEMTEADRAAADVAIKQYDAARKLDFVDDEYANRIERFGTQKYNDYVASKGARAGVKALSEASDSLSDSMQQRGIDPSSGAASALRTGLQSAGGKGAGLAIGEARFNTDTMYMGGRSNRSAMALGDATQAVIGLNDIAGQATQRANAEAFNKFNSDAAMSNAIGTAAGLGLSYYNNRQGNGGS